MSETPERLTTALSGRYRVERELGQGGMATVYLADDLKHDRKVAIKVLRPELAAVIGGERFVAEIKTTAGLQHPHILPLFDSGEADGFLYYVMPYVEGETLRDRLDRERQLGVGEALSITKDVADALDYAHRNGVIHRDIKPENILLHDGRPVVADFGIAVAISAAGGGRMTETGLSLGTPHYMSPEQATADRDLTVRSDVYSLACVLYEMLAGDPPHTGPTAQAILVRILTETPRPVSDTRTSVPPHVASVLAKALEKLPADRFESAAEFREALGRTDFTYALVRRAQPGADAAAGGAAAGAGMAGAAAGRGGTALKRYVPWGISAVMTLLALFLLAGRGGTGSSGSDVVRLDLSLGDVTPSSTSQSVVISSDGSMLAISGRRDGQHAIFVRAIDEADWRPVPGTAGGFSPTFSPEAEWIAFQSNDRSSLIRVSTTGAGTLTLVDRSGVQPYDPHWGGDGTIVFTGPQGLYRVPANGGDVDSLSAALDGRNPHVLPDGTGVLAAGDDGIHYFDVEADSSWLLIPDATHPFYVDTGHLLFVPSGGGLFAVPFEAATGEVEGTPRRVLDRVASFGFGRRAYALARNGTLVQLEGEGTGGTAGGGQFRFVVMGSDETADTLGLRAADVWTPRYSPDGERIAYSEEDAAGESEQIHVFDLRTGTRQQVTFEGDNEDPVWSPDGSRIAFASDRDGTEGSDVWVKRVDNTEPARPLRTMAGDQFPSMWPADTLLLVTTIGAGNRDIETWILPALSPAASGDSVRVEPFLRADWHENEGHLSPDGRLMAIESEETGERDIWLRSFPDPTGQWRVTSGGSGRAPRWSPDGARLFFTIPGGGGPVDTLVSVAVERDPIRLTDRRVELVTDIAGVFNWDLHPNGDRFLVRVNTTATPAASASPDGVPGEERYLVILNWVSEMLATLEGG